MATIKLKRGTSAPTTSNIVDGEVAVDKTTQKLYLRDGSTIKEIGRRDSVPLSGGTMTGNLTLSSASSPSITITDTTPTAVTLKVYSQDAESIIGTYSSHNLGLFTNGTRALTIDTSQNVDIAGIIELGSYAAAQLKVNGYSSSYRSIMIGAPDNNGGSVALAVDVSAFPNTASNFAGKDSVFIGKNGLIFPNNAADNWIGGIARGSSSDVIHVGPAQTGGASSGPLTLSTTDATFAGGVAAASLDISGNIDVDGVTNLDVVDIDGAVDMLSTLAVGGAATLSSGGTIAGEQILYFRDAQIYLRSTTDGQLDLVADTEIELTATTIDINGAVDMSSTLAVGNVATFSNHVAVASTSQLRLGAAAEFLLYHDGTNSYIHSAESDADLIFWGVDGGSGISMLRLDASDAGAATFNNKIIATELDISGNVDVDGTLEADAITVAGSTLSSVIAGTTVANATLAATATVTDSTANTNFPVVFHNESNGLLDDTGALRYNPSTGELLVPKLTVAGTTTTADTVTMQAANAIVFEGATADAHETTLSIVDPTGDHTQYLINQGGYIPLLAAATTTTITSTPEELNALDLGSTAVGTAIASKAVILDSNKDYTGIRNLTLTGNIDVDGVTNLDVVDIDGAVQIDSTVTVGADDTGYDVKFFGATSGSYMLWDESTDDLILGGASRLGIGTTSPSSYLHIEAADSPTMRLVDTTNSATLLAYAQNTEGVVGTYSNHNLLLASNSATALTIDTSQRLLIGHTASVTSGWGGNPQVQIEGTDGSNSSLSVTRNSADVHGGYLILAKSRGGSVGAATIVQDGDTTGSILFAGADGGNRTPRTARIHSEVDGTPGVDDMPGNLIFSTTSDGGQDPTVALTLDSSKTATFSGALDVNGVGPSNFYALEMERSGAGTSPDIWGTSNKFILGTGASTPVLTLSGSNATFAGTVAATDLEVLGSGGHSTNRLKATYNSSNGLALFGPDSGGGSTSLQIGTSNSGTYGVALTIDSSQDATFAGDITAGDVQATGQLRVRNSTTANTLGVFRATDDVYADLALVDNGGSVLFRNYQGALDFRTGGAADSESASGAGVALTLSTSQNATFVGTLTSGTDVGVNSEYAVLGDDTSNRELKFSQYQTGGLYDNAGHKINAASGYGELALAVGGTSRLIIDSSGKVGIGTSSPGHLLHVYGGSGSIANMTVGNPDVALRLSAYTDSHAEIRVETNHDLLFKTNGNNERMRIGATGNATFKGRTGFGYAAESTAINPGIQILTGGIGGGVQLNRETGTPSSGESLGSYAWKGQDGPNTNAAAEALIEAVATENHSGSTAATKMVFQTKNTGTGPGSSPATALTLEANQNATFAGTLDVNGGGSSNFYALQVERSGSGTSPDIWGTSNKLILGTNSSTSVMTIGTDQVQFAKLITGGFGATTTSGTLDFDHLTNSRPGMGYTLLQGGDTNGPELQDAMASAGEGNYYHITNWEYSSKDGSGSLTQMAIPYTRSTNSNATTNPSALSLRTRYSSVWSGWQRYLYLDVNSRTAEIDGALFVRDDTAGSYGRLEVGGEAGAYIDLSRPETDDYDMRFETTGTENFIYGKGNYIRIQPTAGSGSGALELFGKLKYYTTDDQVNYWVAYTDPLDTFCLNKNNSGDPEFILHGNGNLTITGALSDSSDERLKENIQVIPDAVSKVQALRGVTYTRKDNGEKNTGLIAQDVAPVLPELVDDSGDFLALRYARTVGLLVEAIKEQQTHIESLTKRIEELEK